MQGFTQQASGGVTSLNVTGVILNGSVVITGSGLAAVAISGTAIIVNVPSGSIDINNRILTGNWNAQGLAVSGIPVMLSSGSRLYNTATTGTSGALTVDFSGNPNQQLNISTSGSFTFSGTNYPPANYISDVYVYINNTATGACALTFPAAWKNLGGGWPTGLLSGKCAMLWVRAIDTGTTVGSFNVQL
jgi:hypothetical protein